MDDRAEAIDILTRMSTNHFYGHREQEAFKLAVEALKQRWIPVTEELPKLYTDVILSIRQGYAFGEPDNWCVVGQLIDKEDITWATNYGFHDLLYSNGKKHTVWVSAWMPLPSPYKEGEQNG